MLEQFTVQGGKNLKGTIAISGAKNAALKIACAALLTDEWLVLDNAPLLSDMQLICQILDELGVEISWVGNQLSLRAHTLKSCRARYDLVRKMRGSFVLLGPMLSRFGRAEISLPGGCNLGVRPVDIHLNGLRAMGAHIEVEDGYVIATGKLHGAEIFLHFPSVTGTENLVMAATLATGRTVIHNTAKEPEIVDLCKCLKAMGAKITGHGTDTIIIDGVDRLNGATHRIVPDRLETVTYAIANIMTHGHIYLTNTEAWCFDALTECFPQVKIHNTDFGFLAEGPVTEPVNLTTAPHPGMPTDLQAQMMVLATQIPGQSFITEAIFENRMMHVPELCRMGADIAVEHNDGANKATINGGMPLYGAPVMATDLRASVSLVLAGLCAKGQTTISRIYHLDRGYHALDEKLNMCGADIVRSKQEAA